MIRQELFLGFDSLLIFILKILDIFVVSVSFFVAYYFYFGNIHITSDYSSALIFAVLLTLVIFTSTGCYRSWRGKNMLSLTRHVILSWLCVIVCLLVISVLLKKSIVYSRLWFGVWTLLGSLFLVLSRRFLMLFLGYFRSRGKNQKNVLIYGAGDLGKLVASQLKKADWTGYRVTAFFDDNIRVDKTKIDDVPVRYGLDINLEQFILQNQVHEVWIALPLRADMRVRDILHELRNLSIPIRYVPDFFGYRLFLNHGITDVAGITSVELNLSPMADDFNRFIKGLEDRVLSFVFLIIASPVMILIWLAIRFESKGNPIFKQIRHGWNGEEIKVYKFRTMRLHDEKDGKYTQATKGDSRVTRVGAFLRKSSLDELPQLFNVLQGRMSIVGPRPHPIFQNETFKTQIECYAQRHRMKPGMTGWAQINGWRGETDTLQKMQQRVDHDLYYIRNWSLWFDIKIIFLTVFKGFFNENAY